MQITYGLMAMGARQTLNRDYRVLNSRTNQVLTNVGIYRASGNPSSGSLTDLASVETAAVNNGIRVANDLITSYQVADDALVNIKSALEDMQEIVEDVAMNDLTAEEIATKDAEYQTLAGQVTAILQDTEFEDKALLSGFDPVVSLDLNAIVDMEMDNLPTNALSSMTSAIASIGGARNELVMAATTASSAITELQGQALEVTEFGYRVSNTLSAIAVVEALMETMNDSMSRSLSAQSNASPWRAEQLLG